MALKNNGEQIEDLVAYFDMSVNEECIEMDECESYAAFIDADKPVFNIEYNSDDKVAMCEKALKQNLRTLYMNLELDGSERESCDD